MERGRRPVLLVGIGVLIVAGTLVGGALAAPTWTPVGEDGDDGSGGDDGARLTLVGSQSTSGGWHDNGGVYLLNGHDVDWRTDSASSYFDVTRLSDGRVIAAFANVTTDCGSYEAPCASTGYRVLDPNGSDGPTIDSEYAFRVADIGESEVHSVEPLGDGGYLLADMEYERVLIVRDGAMTWQWNASSFYDAPEDPTSRDWLHINDVDAIGESRFLVSVRNANQILVIERDAGVVEVINEDAGDADGTCAVNRRTMGWLKDFDGDGEVRCGDRDVMYNQHNPQWLGDGAVLVADSENDRVVELHRNESTGTWEPAWTLTEAQGIPLEWPRDADRLPNGNTLVTDTANSRIVEVAPNGTTVWSTTTFHFPYEADRLPAGETVGGVQYAAEDEIDAPRERIPVLSTLLVGLRGQFSAIPTWFAELHLVLTTVGVGLVVAGGIDGVVLARRLDEVVSRWS